MQRALLASGGAAILPADVPPLRAATNAGPRAAFASDGLRRSRFRRSETARFLGLSRKTLYNKMAPLGMLSSTAGFGARARV